jgi:hypothetical protein
MLTEYRDPENRKWKITRSARNGRVGYRVDLECDGYPGLDRKNVAIQYAWRFGSEAAFWYLTAQETPPDRLSRIAHSSAPHIHTDDWFTELNHSLWNGAPSFIDDSGTDDITPLMHAVIGGSLRTVESLLNVWKANPRGPSKLPDPEVFFPDVPGDPYELALRENRVDLLRAMVESQRLTDDDLKYLKATYTADAIAPAALQLLAKAVQKEMKRRGTITR